MYQLCLILSEISENVKLQISNNKIQFKIGSTTLISKVIDGKFPDYRKVVPTDNKKILTVASKDFVEAIERVTTVSLDRKEGVKLEISKANIKFSVNSTNSGEGNEVIKGSYNSERR